MTRIAFTVHPNRPEATALAERAGSFLVERGHEVVLAEQTDAVVDLDGADLLVSLGGDGTLLRAVNSARATAVLGVILAHCGYLTEVEPSGLQDALARFLEGRYEVAERMTLSVTVTDTDG